ncbi:MAG: phenylalanine--tRNA ligase subunit beta [Patescibacteria group bacterium]|nr:phenylalanine--tRNA ligase subunit beta [Patescibacteria group bacterium]
MKFSFSLIKRIAPGSYGKEELVERLNLHSFEAVDLGGDVLEIAVTPNRFADAASHIGIAREAAAIFNLPFSDPAEKAPKYAYRDQGVFRVNIKNSKLCRRYMAAYVDGVSVKKTPEWMKGVLESCGLRSINAVVDIMNYVMLEVGQPLHAFDAEKVSGGLTVRNAKKGEKIETIDNQKFTLDSDVLVIADADKPLAIAGIKGGKSSEVTLGTKHLLVEAAHFDSTHIYATSRRLGLQTDASARFAHALSPALVERGMNRALQLLQEIVGAKAHRPADDYPRPQSKEILPFSATAMQRLLGEHVTADGAARLLKKLGFAIRGKKIEVPLVRTDVSDVEDIAEEVARMKGYAALTAQPPHVALGVASEDELIEFKDQIRDFLTGVGYSETYNYSLVAESDCSRSPAIIRSRDGKVIHLANPMSAEIAVLRDSLAAGLVKNLKSNKRFFDAVRVFEIGHVFQELQGKVSEKTVLGMAIAAPEGFFEVKGIVDMLLKRLGVTDYTLAPFDNADGYLKPLGALTIEIGRKSVGYIGSLASLEGGLMELDLGMLLAETDEEREYAPIAKYPAIERDLSFLVDQSVRVGEILALMQGAGVHLVEDVDLVDWYQDEKLGDHMKSLTFRIVFRADDRTLTDAEVDKEMAAITKAVVDKFDVELR